MIGTCKNELKKVTSFTEKFFSRFFVQVNPGQSPEISWTKSCPVIFWTMSSFLLDDKFYSFSWWDVLFFNDRTSETLQNYFLVTEAPIKIDSANLSNFRPIFVHFWTLFQEKSNIEHWKIHTLSRFAKKCKKCTMIGRDKDQKLTGNYCKCR